MASFVLAHKYKQSYWNINTCAFGALEAATIYLDKDSAQATISRYIQEAYDPTTGKSYEDQALRSNQIEHLLNAGRLSYRAAQHVEIRRVVILEYEGANVIAFTAAQYAAICKILDDYSSDDPVLEQIVKSIVSAIRKYDNFPSTDAIKEWREKNQECWHCDTWNLKTTLIPFQLFDRKVHVCEHCAKAPEFQDYIAVKNNV